MYEPVDNLCMACGQVISGEISPKKIRIHPDSRQNFPRAQGDGTTPYRVRNAAALQKSQPRDGGWYKTVAHEHPCSVLHGCLWVKVGS